MQASTVALGVEIGKNITGLIVSATISVLVFVSAIFFATDE